jgi:DNA-binding NtrC family response regulator
MNEKHILLVEDAPEWLTIYQAHLKGDNYIIDTAENVSRAFKLLDQNNYDAVITDLKMIGFGSELGGFSVLEKVKETHPATQVVIITAYGTQEIAFRATQRGAFDIVYKPPDPERLKVTIRGAIQATAMLSQHYSRNNQVEDGNPYKNAVDDGSLQSPNLFGIMGNSRMMRLAFEKISYAVNVDQSVFIFGEKGTGKSYIAKTIHANSNRKSRSFSRLSFSDLSAHWDAVNKNIKRLSGGTFFADNLLSFDESDAKLLTDLCELTEKSNVRLITALTTSVSDVAHIRKSSGLNLSAFDRVISIPVFMPPLRLRKDGDDIPALIGNYIHSKSGDVPSGKQIVISLKAMEKLVAFEYKKENIIELYETLDRTLNLAGSEDEILEEHILTEKKENSVAAKVSDDPLYVFLSYTKDDNVLIDRLQNDLENSGIKIWRDRDKLYPGMRWKSAIRKAVKGGAIFIACFSKSSENRSKTYMYEELNQAIDELRMRPKDRTWFIPVKLNECEIPDWDIGGGETLSDIQHLELFGDWEKGIVSLVSVIKKVSQKT